MAETSEVGDGKPLVYDIDDMPPLREALPLGLQHVLAMFLSNIAVPLIIAAAIGLNVDQTAFLVQMALIVAGVSTIVQSYPIGPMGARIPIVMGTSFAFVAGIIGIGKQFNMATVFGACLAGALVEVIIGFSYHKFKRFFPSLAAGIVVMLIGLTLIPVGADYAAGGPNAPDYGSLGDISGTTAAVNREPTSREMRGGLLADGVMSGIAALFSAFPNTSYSQNVGLVNFTGVVSRHVAAIGGGFLPLLGLIPKVGGAVATIPPAVIGGGALIMFAMIFANGLAIIRRSVTLNKRNLVIIAVSMALGLGVEYRPDVLQNFPQEIQSLLRRGLVMGGLAGFFLNLIFPEED